MSNLEKIRNWLICGRVVDATSVRTLNSVTGFSFDIVSTQVTWGRVTTKKQVVYR